MSFRKIGNNNIIDYHKSASYFIRIQHKNKITPYLGRSLNGVVQKTFVAGREVFNRQKGFVGDPSGEIIANLHKSKL